MNQPANQPEPLVDSVACLLAVCRIGVELPRDAWHEATPEEIAAADVRKEQLRRELEAACAEST